MEIVLLWLDELDDLLFLVALAWERLRRVLLQIGLTASFALAGIETAAVATQWANALSALAAASVSVWLLGAAARAYYYSDPKRSFESA